MWKVHQELILRLIIAAMLIIPASVAVAKSVKLEPLDSEGKRTWIVELADPSVVQFDGKNAMTQRANALAATAPGKTGRHLDLLSPQAVAYGEYLDGRMQQFLTDAVQAIGETPEIRARYKNLINGVALRLTEAQAARLRGSPAVKNLIPNEIYRLETDAGPILIGAGKIWEGKGGLPSGQGEGVVIGIIDTGINWDHISFQDPAPDGYDHTNPLGEQLGLCSDTEVLCSDKIIGVYDFTDEGSKGKDTAAHGSLVGSIVAGNRIGATLEGEDTTLQGVAPRANIISYKVCREDDPDTPDEDEEGCSAADIIKGLEQALTDGVDVVNLSVGGGSASPWSTYATTFLDLRNAGIFTVTSAGNNGPAPASVTNPALAPWLLGVAAATHTRLTGAKLQDFSGGDTEPPQDIAGQGLDPVNGSSDGIGPVDIVFAGDFGNALCGTGEPELGATCGDNTGASNPFAPGTFNGEIVVCERGDYGRVEKGLNVMQAGAGGYILINSEEFGESLRPDNHCIPGIHVGYSKGKELKTWLTSGTGHKATIGPFGLSYETSVADVLADFSSQGPNSAVPGNLVPNITAPGVAILGAGKSDDSLISASGTSFSSPHVAGGGALLLSVDPSLTPSQLQSMFQTTATTQVRNHRGSPATPFEMGSGRIQLAEALQAGLYMDVSGQEFMAANPDAGGDPSTLNLPGMVNNFCQEKCSFSRTVTDHVGGGSWTATAANFPTGVQVTVTPANFTLADGASQTLKIDITLSSQTIGDWVFGEIILVSASRPDQHLTAAVFSYGGDLPESWNISSDRDGGWKEFLLEKLSAMPDATFTVGGLVKPGQYEKTLIEDPSRDDPYDGGEGVMTQWFNVPEGTLWFHNRTPSSPADDLDLFVGRDSNGDGFVEESELLCSSTTPTDIENCDLLSPEPGNYWVIVQNWAGSDAVSGDKATLISAVVGPDGDAGLAVSGPGIIAKNNVFKVRVSWDNVKALPGEEWLGAAGIGTSRERPNNIGIIPVHFSRTGIAAPMTFPLMDGITHGLALDAAGVHDRVFIDVPPGASSLTVTAGGATDTQSDNLKLDLSRVDFDDSLVSPPFATAPGSAPVVVSATGSNGNGPSVTVTGSNLTPGRWHAVLSNQSDAALAVDIRADVEFTGTPIPVHPGLWEPISRPGLGQGYEYNFGGSARALIWYTYDEDGQPVWFIAGNPSVDGNIWTADLLRVTNDGSQQHLAVVGRVSVSLLAENDAMFSYTLYGESGTERMVPLSALTCPVINGSKKSYTALWYRGVDGLGGASVLVTAITQAQIHYLFDAVGLPRWLFVQDTVNPEPTNADIPMLQFSGYCAVCAKTAVTFQTVGLLSRTFSTETTGSWTLNYLLAAPLSGSIDRTDQIIKLTDTIACE